MQRIVILGAGFGGLTLAQELDPLAESGRAEIILIDRNDRFSMGFTKQWVLVGRRSMQDGERPYSALRASHVRFVKDVVVEIDTANRTVRTESHTHPYDRLIIALGAELAPDLIPGLVEGGHNLYDPSSVSRFKRALERFRDGVLALAISSLPFKCPPAPYEYAMLIDDLLRQRGVREQVRIILSTPEPRPMPVAGEVVGKAMIGLLEERNIEFLPNHKLIRVGVQEHEVLFEDGSTLPYDLLGTVPPHRAPKVVRDTALVDESGFVPVDLATFRTSLSEVYAVGDVAALKLPSGSPHPKAGVFAEAQARVVARALAADLGEGGDAEYAGRGICYVDTGEDEAAAAEIHLLAVGGPQAQLHPPSVEGLEQKRQFERERFDAWFAE